MKEFSLIKHVSLETKFTFELDSRGNRECKIDRLRKCASASTYITEFNVPLKMKKKN